MLTKAQAGGQAAAAVILRQCEDYLQTGDAAPLLTAELKDAMAESQLRPDLTRSQLFPFVADRPRARAGAWYEMVPRSQGQTPGQHGTFKDCIARLPDIAAMGFDVVYLTPIHPIGHTNRKGRNNAVTAAEGDPGSPYAIGAAEGGHDAVHPELGTLEDFRGFVAACKRLDMEVALDFAVQCSPDHPWLKQHPQWFRRRPDGSMRYAENPPKKYEDIVNPDFSSEDAGALWNALRDVVLFWIEQGVKIFRVDNPHTKPFRFWEWLIHEIQLRHPDVIFLAEAFTRPKLMKGLAKLGFTQSYTYFTWRTQKWELEQYLNELTAYPERDFYRPNFFVNTPGHPALSPAERRDLDVQIPRRACRHAVEHLRHLQRLRAAGTRSDSRQGRISRFRKIRDQGAGLGQARQYQALHPRSQPRPPGKPGAATDQQSALYSDR